MIVAAAVQRLELGGTIGTQADHLGVEDRSAFIWEAVAVIIKQRTASAGLDPIGYSGRSLRAGLTTSAPQVPTSKIRAQTRHRSDAMLARHIRQGKLFVDNAAGALL